MENRESLERSSTEGFQNATLVAPNANGIPASTGPPVGSDVTFSPSQVSPAQEGLSVVDNVLRSDVSTLSLIGSRSLARSD